ncbi:MAG: hypothetical protein C0594_11710 [Marinilabiliales bacterium]|nr:MAG: hypothetical protein C0594_11710 [Marinilabiliales bacterium]
MNYCYRTANILYYIFITVNIAIFFYIELLVIFLPVLYICNVVNVNAFWFFLSLQKYCVRLVAYPLETFSYPAQYIVGEMFAEL